MQHQFPSQSEPYNRTISELQERLLEQSEQFANVARMGMEITSILELDRVLPAVMETALQMAKVEAGHIILFNVGGECNCHVPWGLSQELVEAIRSDKGELLWDHVRQTGKGLRLDRLGHESNWRLDNIMAHIDGLMAVPLKTQNRTVGAMLVANKVDHGRFGAEDLFALEMLGSFAAVAVENSVLHKQALARQRMEAEMDMVCYVQKTLMPKKIVNLKGLSIVAHNHMAMQVGGDFYDIIELSPEKYILVVADVSSKGLPAALIMTSTRTLIRAYADETTDLARLIQNVNIQLCKDSNELRGMFVTMMAVLIDFGKKVIRSVNAGHPPAFLRLPDGSIQELKTGGPFLGQFDDLKFEEESHPLINGARLFQYTDGVFECTDDRGMMLGLSRLRKFFAEESHLSSGQFIGKLKAILDRYSSADSNVDDTTYLLADVRRI